MATQETVRWFGESWGAPVCDPELHIPTPVGALCWGHNHMHAMRSENIEPGDQGVTLPYLGSDLRPDAEWTTVAYHLDCWLHEIGVDRVDISKENT